MKGWILVPFIVLCDTFLSYLDYAIFTGFSSVSLGSEYKMYVCLLFSLITIIGWGGLVIYILNLLGIKLY